MYIGARYDIGSVWEETTAIKLSGLRHGLGTSLFFDTPIGPAGFSMGQVFKLTRDLPDNPISFGPFYTYLSLGFTLD
jgi:NTE family protein